jgi:NAD(P)-dependent dehydrogenase (short-subunit alcohol dehydrogenase family)
MTRTVVTGASTGIGFGVALRLAQEGHEVHASVRSFESGAALVEASAGTNLSLMLMDVADDDSVADAFSALHVEAGPVDVLINNAGIGGGGSVEEFPLEDFQRMMNTNTWGTVRCTQAVLPSMRERRSGHIINITSLAGRVVQASQAAYAASKFAAEAITEVLAIEMRPFGVRVTAIEPGVIKTPIFSKGTGGPPPGSPYNGSRRLGELFRATLMEAPGTPDMVADAVLRSITGDDQRLRILVGADANSLAEHRSTTSDEEWIERHAEPDDAVFVPWIRALSGLTTGP